MRSFLVQAQVSRFTLEVTRSPLTSFVPAGGSEGDVTYRTDTGTQFKIYFKCASGGNSCTVTPPNMARVTFNASGSPLNGKRISQDAPSNVTH